MNAGALCRLLRALMREPLTLHQLVNETGLHYITVRRYVNTMHAQHLVRVARTAPDSSGRKGMVSAYAFGPGADLRPRTDPSTRAQAQREALIDPSIIARKKRHVG